MLRPPLNHQNFASSTICHTDSLALGIRDLDLSSIAETPVEVSRGLDRLKNDPTLR